MDASTIFEDASTPAVVTQATGSTSALTTASFTPPGGTTVLALWSGNSVDPNVPADPTINAVTGLTWRGLTINKRGVGAPVAAVDGQSMIWWAKVPPGGVGAITVTVNNNAASPNRHAALAVRVLWGAADWPIGANDIISDSAHSQMDVVLTPQGNFSAIYAIDDDWQASGNPIVIGTTTTKIAGGNIGLPDVSYGVWRRNANNMPAGVSGTALSFSTPLGSAGDFKVSWVEILALEDNVARPQIAPGGRSPGSRRSPWTGTARIVAPDTSPILPDATGSTTILVGATSAVVDITAAAVGAWCYAWVVLVANSGTVTATGWTDPSATINADEGTFAHYALLRRQKQPGDTTFTFSWTNSTKGTIGWASYTSLDSAVPDEQATLATNGVTSRTAVPTPSITPTSATRWAVTFSGVRTSTVGNKPITWTADPVLVERLDVDNNAAGSSPWSGLQIADSNGTVTPAAHSYTASHNFAEGHDGSAILFLLAATGGAATNAPAEAASSTGTAADASVDIQINAEQPTGTGNAGDATAAVGANTEQPGGTGQAFDTSVANAANAESPTGTGQAQDASTALTTTAEQPGGTGVAADGTGSIGASPTAATGTGVAQDASTAIVTNAEQAGATGVAADSTGSVGAGPTTATGAGTAADAGVTSAANAEAASGTGVAGDGTPALGVNAESPIGTGTAFDATVSTASATNAPAEAASATGAAQDASVAIAPNAEAPSGTGAAQDASTALTTNADRAAGTGTAADGTGSVGASPGAATGTGSAGDGSNAITVNAEAASGTGTAFDATVSTSGSVNAPAEAATGIGTAQDASTAITFTAGAAAATGAANDAAGSVGASPDTPGATGTALDPATALATAAGTATGSGVAADGTGSVAAQPNAAAGSGTAFDAVVAVYAVGVALGVGQAFNATVAIVETDVAPPHIDARVVVGAIMARVVSPGEPLPMIPGHHARVVGEPEQVHMVSP